MIEPPDFTPKNTFGPHNLHAARLVSATRQTLGRKFVRDLQAQWEEQGEAILRRVAFHNPEKVLAAMVQLMPTQTENVTPVDGISDDRLAMMLDLAERMIQLRQGASPPLLEGETVEGAPGVIDLRASQVEEGGGGPPALGPSGEGNDVVHTAPSPQNGLPDFSGEAAEDEVDPASLF